MNRACCFLILAAVSSVFVPLCLITSFYILPSVGETAMRSALILDTPSKFDQSAFSEVMSSTETFTFFNLTNAYELQTQTPAPKPIFREVNVTFTRDIHNYNYAAEEDGDVMTYRQWFNYQPINPADFDLEIVNVNPLLLQTIQLSGTETFLGPVLSMMTGDPAVSNLIQQTLTFDAMAALLRPDGTGNMNVGPFIRLTVREILMGWQDPLFAPDGLYFDVAPTGLFVGLPHSGVPSVEAQEDMIATGLVPVEYVEVALTTGKSDIDRLFQWARYLGQVNFTAGQPLYPGWGLDGEAGAPFVIAGTATGFGLPPLEGWPNVFAAGGVNPKVSRNLDQVSMLEEFLAGLGVMRMMNYVAAGDESLFGKLHTQTFEMDADFTKLTVGGNVDEAGECAASATCDFEMQIEGVMSISTLKAAPMAMTLPYLGATPASVRDAVTILPPGADATEELNYDASFMCPKVWLEPLSGAVVKKRVQKQYNYVLDKRMLDGPLFANVFSGDTDNGDVLVMPYVLHRLELGGDEDDVTEAADQLSHYMLFMMLIFTFAMINVVLAILFAVLYFKDKSKGLSTAPDKAGTKCSPVAEA